LYKVILREVRGKRVPFMLTDCNQALEVDLAAVFTEPQSPEWEEFRLHYPQCERCSAEVAKWRKLEQVLKAAGKATTGVHPAEETLLQFHHNAERLSPAERQAIQQHLQICRACTEGLSLATSFDFSLIQKWIDEERAIQVKDQEKAGALSHLIVQIARKGLRLVEQHLVPPLLGVQEMPMPLPAYRRQEEPSALNLKIAATQAEITVTVVQDEESIACKMTFLGTGQQALAGQQVFLRRQGRLIFSAQTDADGVLRTPRLKPAPYEVACPGVQTTFQLEFRS
jgi:hypothetical protein